MIFLVLLAISPYLKNTTAYKPNFKDYVCKC